MDLLSVRSDNKRLQKMVTGDERFDHIDEETLETAAVLLNAPSMWQKRKSYVNDDEGRDYNMCKALEDWAAEIRAESDEVIKKKDAELEENRAQLEQNRARIDDLQRENAMLRAQLASAGK